MVQIGRINFFQRADVTNAVEISSPVIILKVNFLDFGHPDAVQHLHRLDVVPLQAELAKATELYLRNQAEDLSVEEVS